MELNSWAHKRSREIIMIFTLALAGMSLIPKKKEKKSDFTNTGDKYTSTKTGPKESNLISFLSRTRKDEKGKSSHHIIMLRNHLRAKGVAMWESPCPVSSKDPGFKPHHHKRKGGREKKQRFKCQCTYTLTLSVNGFDSSRCIKVESPQGITN